MAADVTTPDLLRADNARIISNPTKTPPYWGGRSPKWICRVIQGTEGGCLSVTGGAYQINQVNQPFLPIQAQHGGTPLNLPSKDLRVHHSHEEGAEIAHSYVEYAVEPRVIELQTIQSVVKVHRRITDLYSDQHDQLELQLGIVADYMYETKENLIFNHPDYGLLNNVAPKLNLGDAGAPTPDVLDDMLSRVWKMPEYFVMHPEVLDAFRRELNARGLVPETVQMFGHAFTCWRGLPILPTNKLHLTVDGEDLQDPDISERKAGSARSTVLLMRIGETKQGVVSLYAAGTEGTDRFPFIDVEYMSTDASAVSSYLMTMYAGMGVLTPGCLSAATVTL